MRTRTFLAAATLTLGGLLAAPAFAQADADPYRAFVGWYQEQSSDGERPTPDEMSTKIMEMAEGMDFSTMTFNELRPWTQLTRFAGDLATKVDARMETLAAAPTVDGAQVAIMRLSQNRSRDVDETMAKVKAAMNHPMFEEALAAGDLGSFLGAMGNVPAPVVEQMADRIRGLARLVDAEMPPAEVGALRGFAEMLKTHKDVLGEDFFRTTRVRIADRMRAAVTELAESGADEAVVKRMVDSVAYVDGAYMRDELVDHPAPTVAFDWWSGEENVSSLQDLKGEVIVLDFWATWCGPCIASMPNIKELVERYEGYPVKVVGVTSLQGRHYPQGGDPIDCTGDAQKEYNLMPEFMESMAMTWPVAFSTQNVFNPDFGVRGIPHVAIIDPSGVVRFRGLHPAGALSDKAEKIDKLLAEAGLPHPAPVTDETAGGE